MVINLETLCTIFTFFMCGVCLGRATAIRVIINAHPPENGDGEWWKRGEKEPS